MKKKLATLMTLSCLMAASALQAADLKDQLLVSDKKLWTARAKKDAATYKKLLAADAEYLVAGSVPFGGREAIAFEVESSLCTREKFKIENVTLRQLAPTVAALYYDAFQTGDCDGTPLPTKVRATSIYVKQGNQWLVSLYQETPIELE